MSPTASCLASPISQRSSVARSPRISGPDDDVMGILARDFARVDANRAAGISDAAIHQQFLSAAAPSKKSSPRQ